MRTFKTHTKTISFDLDEGRVRDTLTKLKTVWSKLKRAISNTFSKLLKKATIGQEVKLTIPGQTRESMFNENGELLMEASGRGGELEVVKGNYNEALVLQYIYDHKGDGVNIRVNDKEYDHSTAVKAAVEKWKKHLRDKVNPKDLKKAEPVILKGSEDMAKYLVGSAIQEDSTIIGAKLDNLAFLVGGIEAKADIVLWVQKEGKVVMDAYSLKLYGTKSVGLANSTAAALTGHLAGSTAQSEVEKVIANDPKLAEMIEKSAEKNLILQDVKAHLKGDENGTRKLKQLRGFSDKEIAALTTADAKRLRIERGDLRTPINPRIAEIVYKVVNKYAKKDWVAFGENVLAILGFKDKHTKMLMGVLEDPNKRTVIIDNHPDLDLSNITLEHVGVSIKIMGPPDEKGKKKTIVTFGVKEGEKKAVTGKVSFAGVTPVDLANFPIFSDI
jgi:hypothetical protein